VKAATFQSLTDISNDYVMQIAADPELARILHTARASGLAALTQTDSARFWSLERAFWVRMQNVFSQYSRGTLTDDDFRMYREVICGSAGGTRDMWPEHRGILSAALVRLWKTAGTGDPLQRSCCAVSGTSERLKAPLNPTYDDPSLREPTTSIRSAPTVPTKVSSPIQLAAPDPPRRLARPVAHAISSVGSAD
jgi:hypothetical protein